jgi:hypothetical protein
VRAKAELRRGEDEGDGDGATRVERGVRRGGVRRGTTLGTILRSDVQHALRDVAGDAVDARRVVDGRADRGGAELVAQAEGRSIRANVGVEFIGVSWS